ncbi:hypothetical protein [Cryobacterium sp. N22]|uniref:hypothetical protein n=1 Tax=Cryobacterium sp. N22 TaxID=2048290 RepID=UPI000CE38774|nr:hypothetical protein [Cryobacterium sp. N22]
MRRSLVAVGMALGVATMLSSCFLPANRPQASEPPAEPGISREAAGELLNAVPGLQTGTVGSVISGLSYEVIVEVSVDDAASILAPGVLDYVLRVGWATELPNEPTILSLTVRNNGTTLDLQSQAQELTGGANLESVNPFSAYLDAPADYLGDWPGAVPTPPTLPAV